MFRYQLQTKILIGHGHPDSSEKGASLVITVANNNFGSFSHTTHIFKKYESFDRKVKPTMIYRRQSSMLLTWLDRRRFTVQIAYKWTVECSSITDMTALIVFEFDHSDDKNLRW